MFGALAVGETVVEGLLEGEDVHRTAAAMRAFGADVRREADGLWRIRGVGVGGLVEPDDVLDLGNSGTSARLLLGLAASHPLTAVFTGDASLRRRPMERAMAPLRQMGAVFHARAGGRLPATVLGSAELLPIEYRLPVPSAQVKSAILLAGLNTAGETAVVETEATRDHTENMLRHFGAEVAVAPAAGGGARIAVRGQPELLARPVVVPGDPSSAAFPAVAAAIRPGAEVRIDNVGLNPLRAGLFLCLEEMGCVIRKENARTVQHEPVADLVVLGGGLRGIEVPAERAPSMIDEYPVLAVAAAFAEGTTVMRGLAELRVKESDRLAAIARGLAALGVRVEELPDGLVVHGTGGAAPAADTVVRTHMDHRIAMSFLVYGTAARGPVTVDDGAMIETSFPGFAALMNGLGAMLHEAA